ncbi:MAG: hypothetical protein VXU48_00860, partial [Verrucomicrobiota bacterium]|nr:hypothetical protein [Verrucomicrobiota bacterium]
TRSTCTVRAIFSCILLTSLAHGQNIEESFRGTWKIDTPKNGALIIIVNTQARASYFWADNTDRTVYQGAWLEEESTAVITWPDGSKHHITRSNLDYMFTYFDTSDTEQYTAIAQRLPDKILGQWAKPAKRVSEDLSARDRAQGFFGVWKIGEGDASVEYVFVEEDRSAASTEGDQNGHRGSWVKQGSELHITWDSGHYSIIREGNRGFSYKSVAPGAIIEEDTTEMRPAVRTIEEKIPTAWMALYKKERELNNVGIAFSSRKDARTFYRGDWIFQIDEEHFQRVEIGRFGGLKTSTKTDLEGDWRMQGQDIFMRWDDGMRLVLSPIGRSFVVYEYKPGRPLDGVPTRTLAATPADSTKLDEHLKGRINVAQQIIQLAQAAGIDQSQKDESGWKRNFARWVWPFGENEDDAIKAADILEEEYDGNAGTDPWWWPLWSNPKTSTNEDQLSDTSLSTNSETKTALDLTSKSNKVLEKGKKTLEKSTDSEMPAIKKKKKRALIRDWVWPF